MLFLNPVEGFFSSSIPNVLHDLRRTGSVLTGMIGWGGKGICESSQRAGMDRARTLSPEA